MTEKYIIATLFRLANQLLQLASVSISTDTDFENLPRTLLMSALPFYSPASCWIFITTLTIATSVILPLRFPLPAFLSTQLTARDAKCTYWAVNSQAQGVDSFLVPLSHALSYAQILRPPPPPNTCLLLQTHSHIFSTWRHLLGTFIVPGSTMLLFALLAWGELAQVELMDLKVVEWSVGAGGEGATV